MLALCTSAVITRPTVSTIMWRFLPFIFFPVLDPLFERFSLVNYTCSYSYGESWYASSNIPHFTDIFRSHVKREGSKEFDIKNYIRQCSFDKLQELCKAENIQNSSEIMNFISHHSLHYCTQHTKKPATEEEIKQVVLVQVLDEYIDRLKEEFKKEKTWFQRKEEEIQQIQEHIQETEKKIAQEAKKAEQEAKRAEKLELENTVMKLTTQSLRKFKSDNELRDIVRDSEDDIVTEVVQCVIEHRSSPEQVLDAIIEEIKSNADQIKRDGKVNVELIENVVKGFSSSVNGEQTEPDSEREEKWEPQKSLDDNHNNDQELGNKTDKQNVSRPIITASAGLLLGLSIAYLAGAAALPIIGAVAVFIAVAIVGASVGYGVGKVSQKLFVESITEHSKQGLGV